MKLKDHIAEMQRQEKLHGGDIEVTMLATVLPEGYNRDGSTDEKFGDVFVSTVETSNVQEHPNLGKTLQLYYQQ